MSGNFLYDYQVVIAVVSVCHLLSIEDSLVVIDFHLRATASLRPKREQSQLNRVSSGILNKNIYITHSRQNCHFMSYTIPSHLHHQHPV